MKEERIAILRMLENGIISAEEAERLLNVLNTNGGKDVSDGIEGSFAKVGSSLESVVENVGKKAGLAAKIIGEKAEQAKPEIKKAAKTFADKITEAADTIKEDFNKKKAEKGRPEESDFVYEGQAKEDKSEANEGIKTEDAITYSTQEGSLTGNYGSEQAADISMAEEEKINEDVKEEVKLPEDDDGRDYEAEYYQMMKETNGDIFGDVYQAIDNLKGIERNTGITNDSAENNETDK